MGTPTICWRVAIALLALVASSFATEGTIAHEELVRNTQELFDAVAVGDKAPWQKYFADDSMYFDEKGKSWDKTSLVNELAPLPKGYSGSIKIAKAQSRIVGNTAILSYDLDESETIFGQKLSARYHGTDTWMYRNGKWQIVAGQMFRYYEDPAPGRVDPKKFSEYAGVYQLAPGITATISTDGQHLYYQRGDRPKEVLIPEATDIFFRKGAEGRRLFRYGESGKVDALIDRRNNEDVIWTKIPSEKEQIRQP